MKKLIGLILILFLLTSNAYAGPWGQVMTLEYRPERDRMVVQNVPLTDQMRYWLQHLASQEMKIDQETMEECGRPIPWVVTNPKTGKVTGVIKEVIYNSPNTCQYRVLFTDTGSEEIMVTLSQGERDRINERRSK